MAGRDQETKLSVPKFSSFKSKEAPKEPEKQHEIRKKRGRDDKAGGRSDEHHRSRHSRHETHRHKERRRSRSREKTIDRVAADSKSVLKQGGVPGLFVIDTKGDPLILKYGGIDRSQIPAYRRYGSGRVMGTTGRLVIHRDGTREQFSLRMPGEGSSAFTDRDGLRSKVSRINPRPVMLRARHTDTADDEIEEGYLPLSSSRKRKRGQTHGDSTDEDEQQPSYRSIEGKAKPRQDWDSDSDEDSDTSMEITITAQNNPLSWRSIQLNKRVKDSPEDIDAWLELVDHQDALLKAGDIDHTTLENEAHSYAEIKVSMLESALSNTKSAQDRSRVLVYLMREGVKVWTSKVATKKWTEALKDEDGNFALWKTHLDFLTSNITIFQYEDIKKMLLDRIRHGLSRIAPDSPKRSFEEAICVFLRATRFVHDAGYKELAVAAWQGLLELNLFRLPRIENEQSALESFHNFWESEVPRIGDADAKGWSHFVESGGVGDAREPVMDDSTKPPSSRDAYKAWRCLEQLCAQKAKMPARTMDDGTDDDPFRVVIYSDIEPFLFLIPDSILPDIMEQLIDAFLLFSGFPPAFRTSDWTEAASCDQFLISTFGIDLQAAEKDDAEGSEHLQRKRPQFNSHGLYADPSPSLLFGGERWFQYVASKPHDHIVDLPWMLEMLKQIIHSAGVEGLAQYYLALCFSTDPVTIKKPGKALLKRFPANSELYNAYALAEVSNDPGVASKVLGSATESSSLSAKWHGFLFFKTWSWIELEMGNKDLATRRLCSSVDDTLRRAPLDGSELGNTTLLKAHQIFTASFHDFLLAGDLDGASTLAECLALLAYLTAEGNSKPTSTLQGNIATAMSTIEMISQEFRSRRLANKAAHERVLQFGAQLLYLNASKGPFRRVYMREQLSRFIGLFPRNTIFLSLFEWSDANLRITDETRDLLHEKVLLKPHDCISSRAFSIQHELTHGNANTTKAAFEHAVSSDACKNNPTLWISYIRFCHSQKQFRAKANDVFYRALRHCPGSKDVMMEAFVTLIRDMGSEELRAVHNTMTSKGMRVHVDLEEFLDKRPREKRR